MITYHKLIKFSISFFISFFIFLTFSLNIQAASNLVTNPGAESNFSGWNVVNGGSGWAAGGVTHNGDKSFVSSYAWGSLNQEIDLVSKGYSAASLDTQPRIRADAFVYAAWGNSPTYRFKVELRNASHGLITSYDTGVQNISSTGVWYQLTHTFSSYGTGVRYIYVEIGAKDGLNWAGNYGPNFDDLSVLIADSATDKFVSYTSASNNGKVTDANIQVVPNNGTSTAVNLSANSGYHFTNWSDASTANPRSDANIVSDLSVTANFAINSYTLTYTAGSNGTITGSSPQTVSSGSSGSAVTAVANTGYAFSQWSDSSSANPRTDSNVTNNISVTGNFSANTYSLSFDPQGGTVSPTSKSVTYNSVVGQLPTPTKNGYIFSSWNSLANGSGDNYSANTVYQSAGNKTLYAQWSIPSYSLVYTAGNGGTISGSSSQTVSPGQSGTSITAVPKANYHFVNWSDSSTTNPRQDINVQSNVSVTANFALDKLTLTYTASSSGTLTGTTNQSVDYGADGTAVTAVPNSGYAFLKWSDNSTVNPRTDRANTKNLNLTAEFTNTRTISTADVATMQSEVTNGFITLAGSDPTTTENFTFKVNYTFSAGDAQVVFPAGTVVTKSGGGTLDLTNFSTTNNTAQVRNELGGVLGSVKIGIPSLSLSFSDKITVTIPVGTNYNGQTLTAYYRSEGSTEWKVETTCVITNGNCTFQTNHATTFTARENTSNNSTSNNSNTQVSSTSDKGCANSKPSGLPDLFQIDVKDTEVTLHYTPITENISNYYIAYSLKENEYMYGVNTNQSSSNGALSFTVGSLSPNTIYFFKIQGQNNCMPGDWSNQMKIITNKKGNLSIRPFYKNSKDFESYQINSQNNTQDQKVLGETIALPTSTPTIEIKKPIVRVSSSPDPKSNHCFLLWCW